MRGSAWMFMGATIVAWAMCIGWPVIALILKFENLSRTDVEILNVQQLLFTSLGWAAVVAAGSTVIGWAPGRLLGRALQRRGFVPLAVLLVAPICLPAYVVFFAWWQSWPSGTALYQWIVTHHWMQNARQVTLLIAMLCWSWPLVTWCVAGSVAATPAQRDELLRLDCAPWRVRVGHHLRSDCRGLLIGALLVFLATLNNTTCFDLSEVFTFSNELRAIQALGANARDVMIAGAPGIAILAAGAVAVWLLMTRKLTSREPANRAGRMQLRLIIATLFTWTFSVVLPMALFARNVSTAQNADRIAREFFTLYSQSVVNTMALAAGSGLIGALLAMTFTAAWQDHRRPVRWIATVMAISWLIAAAVPGTIVGEALEAAFNRGALANVIYSNPTILIIGHLAAFGFVAVLLGRWAAMQEPRPLADLRRLDGAFSIGGWLGSAWPRLLAVATASFAVIFVLAIGEIPVTAMVHPPMRAGAGPLALTLLNDMHYQRPQTVMIAALGMMALALIAAITVCLCWLAVRRCTRSVNSSIAAAIVLIGSTLALAGCDPNDSSEGAPLKPTLVFGASGNALGQFGYPRAIDVDALHQWVYVIDKTARVQRFGFDGRPQLQWHMPEMQNGKPTGVSVAPDGRVFVADTHYFRVIAYDSQGNELFRFGEYGTGPSQFIYTTDIAFGPQGRLYVSEYGGHDRVQVFTADGKFLSEFGSFGPDAGQFSRPQSLAFSRDRAELFIADACNHRIVVVDPEGKFKRMFGSPGREPGQFTYPYGVIVLDDGTLLVSEFGNNRVQHVDAQGKCLGLFGRVGRNQGELQYPWASAAAADRLFILDSGNNRVQVMKTP